MGARCGISELATGTRLEVTFNGGSKLESCIECLRTATLAAIQAGAAIANDDMYGTADAIYGYDAESSSTTFVVRTDDGAEIEEIQEDFERVCIDSEDLFVVATIGRAAIVCQNPET